MNGDCLSDEQIGIANEPVDARLLVTAGPGTGKTFTLIERLAKLTSEDSLMPGSDLLVLSFSRAAVREIRARAKQRGGELKYVQARTFDSFATCLLRQFAEDDSWSRLDYDGRIRCATNLIRISACDHGALVVSHDLADHIASFRHVMIDELQDVVGERAEFVQTILSTVSGGFTLLGDPAQGIYNFQLSGPERREGSSAIYRWIREQFGDDLVEKTLSINHRASSDVARSASHTGVLLNSRWPDYEKIWQELESVLHSIQLFGSLSNHLVCRALADSTTQTAILCRDNGQALWVSRHLSGLGVRHRLRRSATDRVVPAWIGAILGGVTLGRIGLANFTERAARICGAEFDTQNAWRLLRRTAPSSGNDLDLMRLGEAIRIGDIPDDLCAPSDHRLTVSTIHRAKGLEYEQVLIPDFPRDVSKLDYDLLAEECRVLYVALTRPKRELKYLNVKLDRGYMRDNVITDRWVKHLTKWKITDVEIKPDDIHKDDPAGGYLLECDAFETQTYIQREVEPGDPVVLRIHDKTPNHDHHHHYVIEHLGKPVGITSDAFASSLFATLKLASNWEVKWPRAITQVYVDDIDTVAGTSAASERSGLGSSGLWMRVRVAGLGSLVFTDEQPKALRSPREGEE